MGPPPRSLQPEPERILCRAEAGDLSERVRVQGLSLSHSEGPGRHGECRGRPMALLFAPPLRRLWTEELRSREGAVLRLLDKAALLPFGRSSETNDSSEEGRTSLCVLLRSLLHTPRTPQWGICLALCSFPGRWLAWLCNQIPHSKTNTRLSLSLSLSLSPLALQYNFSGCRTQLRFRVHAPESFKNHAPLIPVKGIPELGQPEHRS